MGERKEDKHLIPQDLYFYILTYSERIPRSRDPGVGDYDVDSPPRAFCFFE